jgi:hypothetical protein
VIDVRNDGDVAAKRVGDGVRKSGCHSTSF